MAYDGYGMPKVDFSKLSELGDIYNKERIGAVRERTLAQLGQGANVSDVSRALFQAGDVQGGMSLANLANTQAQQEWNRTYQGGMLDVSRQNAATSQRQADATIEGGRVPPGWRRSPAGELEVVPRGPADPSYIQQTAEARARPRELSVTDITKLNEEGSKFANLATFTSTFKPTFSGFRSEGIGNVAMWMGRNNPDMVSENTKEASKWWQQYDRFKNVVRNELFGAALTATEKAAFERADINAGMDAETIKTNLETQQSVYQNGLKRKANAMIQAGYDPAVISQAYGLNLQDIGVTAQPRRGGAAPTAPAAPPNVRAPVAQDDPTMTVSPRQVQIANPPPQMSPAATVESRFPPVQPATRNGAPVEQQSRPRAHNRQTGEFVEFNGTEWVPAR